MLYLDGNFFWHHGYVIPGLTAATTKHIIIIHILPSLQPLHIPDTHIINVIMTTSTQPIQHPGKFVS